MKNDTAVAIVCNDDFYFLEATIRSFTPLPVTVFISSTGFDGSLGNWEPCVEAAEKACAEVVLKDFDSESGLRSYALATMKDRGVRWLFIPDSDEIIEKRLLDAMLEVARTGLFDLIRVRMRTFWKSLSYLIQPPEELAPILLIDAQKCEHVHIREYSCSKPITLGFEHGCLFHASYAGPDARIARKLSCWGHRSEVLQGWYEKVWLAWDKDRTMRNLHPTHPACYGFAERIEVPEELKGVADYRTPLVEPPVPARWLRISVVIPVYGGPDLLRECLRSLQHCGVTNGNNPAGQGEEVIVIGKRKRKVVVREVPLAGSTEALPPLLHEVIVVDDCSPDDAAEVVKEFPFVKFIQNKENLGFGGTSNVGCQASTGDAVLFLNSDTQVTRAGILRLGESLLASGTIGAVGPYTNYSGYYQQFTPTYTDPANLEKFAIDFAHREVPDLEVSMIVGFALLVRRSVLEEVGLFGPIFTRGLYEDTDLITRIAIAGYKTKISSRAYIHHEGSKSLNRMKGHPVPLLEGNRQIYDAKWRLHLETGHASHLPGQAPEPIRFNQDREPSVLRERLRKLCHEAGISLCMIVRNEERVLGACLESTWGVFPQVIIVDTGSTDRTIEIARSFGAEVYEVPWAKSFSEARNASLTFAKGRWVLWVDADDTIPLRTLEAMILAALEAPRDVNGFVIPVQFVDSNVGEGTRVDHVKLFRNDPRHRFEGRIHEQILGALRATGGRTERLDVVVLHSGYDVSPDGQKRKRIRDRELLVLDLTDRPKHPFVLFNLGMTAYFCGRFRAAIGWLKRCIRESHPDESHLRKAFALYGLAVRALNRIEESIEIFEQGLLVVGEDPELRFNLGMSCTALGRFAGARAHYQAINPDTSGFFSSIDIGILGHRRLNNLASVCMAMGLEREAKQYHREAIASNPRVALSIEAFYETGLRTGDIHAMREASDAMFRAFGACERWAQMRAGIAEVLGRDPEQDLLQLVHEMPQAMGPGLVLARRQLARGLVDIPLLSHLEGLGSGEAAKHLASVELSRGNLEAARRHASFAMQLAPNNPEVIAQFEAVEVAFDDQQPLPDSTDLTNVLEGPHVGKLGPASIERSVVVVTFNSSATICECLTCVLRTLGPNDELIVVDSGSSDDTPLLVNELLSGEARATFLPQAENLGYSPACNIGILASKGAHIVTLNPDAFVLEGWLDGMSASFTGDVAAVGPVSDAIAGEQFVGHYLGDRHAHVPDLAKTLAVEQAGKAKPTKLLMGVCLMMRRDLLDKHGLLCEETFLGADDLEFSWRYRELGYRLVIAPSVFVRHVGGASFSTVPRIETRKKVRRSDRALIRRLRAYYGDRPIPSSRELFGCDIFAEALASIR
jgi:GT2 family glycosyltransferase/tetratricopeptide (TPR) repeat protein